MSKIKAREGILSIPPYLPGRPVEEVKKEYGLAEVVSLANNENPRTSPKALEAMRAAVDHVYLYPDGSSRDLREALAVKHGLAPSQIMVANGGDQIIVLIAEAFVNEGEEVIVARPSFVTYKTAATIAGGKLISVPVKKDSLEIDLEATLAAVTERTKLIFLCNPNNPTATIVRRREVEDFLAKVPDHCLVVFDEAYFEYVGDPEYPDGIEYVKRDKNVIVIRTFSKIYGLAGQRIGYALAPEEIMDTLFRVLPPFPANRVAQAGALAALSDYDFVDKVIKENNSGRAYLCGEFEKLGLSFVESWTNYIFVDVKREALSLSADLLKLGFIIRPGGGWGYSTCCRISIGTMDQNEKFIAALKKVLNS